jgi:hypothetical protein
VTRVLIVGVPRSGTTWVSRILGSTPGAIALDEPDNHFYFPFAYRAKLKLRTGHFPYLAPTDEAPELDRLWRAALSQPPRGLRLGTRVRRSASMRLLASAGVPSILAALGGSRRPTLRLRVADALAVPEQTQGDAEHLVVKSVYALLTLDWLLARHAMQVVVVVREPLNILSSWIQMGWLGRPGDDILDTLKPSVADRLASTSGAPRPASSPRSVLSRATWLLGLLTSALKKAVERHPEWHVVVHEELCRAPNEGFRALVEEIGLEWDPAVDRLLQDTNQAGRGYEMNRVRASLPDAWRSRLSPADSSEIMDVLSAFPIADWTHWRSKDSTAPR